MFFLTYAFKASTVLLNCVLFTRGLKNMTIHAFGFSPKDCFIVGWNSVDIVPTISSPCAPTMGSLDAT
jgi:hypothetical protein